MILSLTPPSLQHSPVDPEGPQIWAPLDLPSDRLFGTDGIRGHYGDRLTPALAVQVGFWAGRTLLEAAPDSASPKIILGRDSRNSGEVLATALAAGLTAAGCEVLDLGLCPTPAVAHLAQTTEALGGVMISASHNPPEDNGIKFFDGSGAKLSVDRQRQIETALREACQDSEGTSRPVMPLPQWAKYSSHPELVDQYLTSLCAPLPSLQDLTVVLDLAWGASAHTAPAAFRQLGATVHCLHASPDGDRINVNCGSTHPAALAEAVVALGADVGFAFDGDADRVIAVDNQGRVVDGDYILYLWGIALRKSGQLADSTIVTTVMSNLGFERAWQRQGGTFVRTKVGDQYVQAEMNRRGAQLGGEQSGHVLCPRYSVSGDGTLTALHLAALVHRADHCLATLVDQSFQTYPQVLKNVRVDCCDRRRAWDQDPALQTAIATAEAAMGDDGRVLIRASGTEPVIRVMVEAASDELVQHWTAQLVAAVEAYAS
ncbi:MAG: phosphoglucosamine mutase [Cyanobacteria bacterium P01_A01_bin.135]